MCETAFKNEVLSHKVDRLEKRLIYMGFPGEEWMKRISVLLVFLLAAWSVIGCAGMSENQCLEADWYEIGRQDGNQGKAREVFQKHYKRCLEYGVQAQRDAYFCGRAEGLKHYCTYDNGLSQGRRGRAYRFVCPASLEPDFLAGYENGKLIRKYETRIHSLQRDVKAIEKKIKAKEKELYASRTAGARRAVLRSELKTLDMEYRDAVRRIHQLEEALADI